MLERAQESFEAINAISKGKCMGADPSGTQSTEQRQSTKVHKNIYPCHVLKQKSRCPVCLLLSLGSSAGLPAQISVHPSSVSPTASSSFCHHTWLTLPSASDVWLTW